MFDSLGETQIFGLGRGDGIGRQLPELPGVNLGDRLTFSSA